MKFGGTSVADLNIMRNAILKIVEEVKNKKKVIVVVSAMGSTTDNLVRKIKEVSSIYDAREYDAILSTGENISASIMALLLQNEGINSRSWQGWQIPIITTDNHSNARILDINTKNIETRFTNGMQVAIVAGFQGISSKNRITTLGRGGSDTSAVALAAVIGAERCDIYTDVDGVYTADPRIVANALKLETITFEEMLELASQGAKVLQTRSVALAMNHNVKLQVLSSFENKTGTFIINERQKSMEETIISGITYTSNEAKITLFNVIDKPGQAAMIFGALADQGINVDMIVQTSTKDGEATDITFTVLKSDLLSTKEIIENLKNTIKFKNMVEDSKVSKVSVVGSGMRTKPGVAKTMFKTLADNNINIQVISTSEIKISVLISSDYTELAVRTLHDAFGLGKDIKTINID